MGTPKRGRRRSAPLSLRTAIAISLLAATIAAVGTDAPVAHAQRSTQPDPSLSDGGEVLMWGSNYASLLGNGEIGEFRNAPAGVPGLSGVVQLTSGSYPTFLARDTQGRVWGWGENVAGVLLLGRRECGPSTDIIVSSPRQLPLPGAASDIDMEYGHGLAVIDGKVVEWGDSDYSGCEDTDWYSQAVTHPFPTNVVEVAADADMNLALTADGKVYSWAQSETPELLPELNNIVSIDAGAKSQVALAADGTVYTWTNKYDSSFTDSDCLLGMFGARPNRPTALPLTEISAVSMSFTHTLALKRDGSVFAFGRNTGGLPDNSDRVLCEPTRMEVTGATQVAAGVDHSIVAKANGDVVGWGSNDKGQLAIEPIDLNRVFPPTKLPISNIERLEAGNEVSAAISTQLQPETRRITLSLSESCDKVWSGIVTRSGSAPDRALAARVKFFNAGMAVGELTLAPGIVELRVPSTIDLEAHTTASADWGASVIAVRRQINPAIGCTNNNLIYAALGDSYSSGEGNPPFHPGTEGAGSNNCHRSGLAFPELVTTEINADLQFVACSGATTYSLMERLQGTPSQLSSLSEDTDLVTVTIGGNNLQFSFFARSCSLLVSCYVYYESVLDTLLTLLRDELIRTYKELSARASNASTIAIVGYPRLFPSEPYAWCNGFEESEQRWINRAVASLNNTIVSAIHDAQLAAEGRLLYVSTWEAFQGGELCSDANKYVIPVGSPARYSLHPTALGHIRIAAIVSDSLN